jgi:hypothetical protein
MTRPWVPSLLVDSFYEGPILGYASDAICERGVPPCLMWLVEGAYVCFLSFSSTRWVGDMPAQCA